jgi:hypothetical protein
VQGQKRYDHSDYPTFDIHYRKAIPAGKANAASFDFVEAGISQEIKFNMFDRLNYMVNAGAFLSSRHLYLPDYKHFRTSQLFVTTHDLENSFSLLSDYTNSTAKQWLQAHLTYTSAYLLIKHLPFMQNYLFDESLHLRTLFTPSRKYLEAGYSAGIGDIGRVGVFVGSNQAKYLAVGFTISLPLLR